MKRLSKSKKGKEMDKTPVQHNGKWELMFFGLSVLGCVVGLLFSFFANRQTSSELSSIHLVFVIPSVIFFVALAATRLRRKKIAEKAE